MKKVILLSSCYFLLGVPVFIVSSCDGMKYDATHCGLQSRELLPGPDTFSTEIHLRYLTQTSSPSCMITLPQLFAPAMATTKCAEFHNKIRPDTYELLLDKAVILDQDTLSAGTNLLSNPGIFSSAQVDTETGCKFTSIDIRFPQYLVDRMSFDSTEYTVTFTCRTNDSKSFSVSRGMLVR